MGSARFVIDKRMKLILDSVTYRFCVQRDSHWLLSNVSLEIHQGEFVSVVGRSGSGKSTLLNLIAGFCSPVSGRITNTLSTGYVLQECPLFPWLNVIDNVCSAVKGASPRRLSKEELKDRALSLLEQVGLSGRQNHFPRELSGGERSRASLAQILALDRELLLLDEPFASLDAFTRKDMNALLQQIVSSRSLTVLLVTHDLEEAVFLSDRVLVMNGSKTGVGLEQVISLPKPRTRHMCYSQEFLKHKELIEASMGLRI